MLPPAERVTTFHVGARELDPVEVGFVTGKTTGAFLFDSSASRNSNAGHPYGGVLADGERSDLIDFLKTL